MGRLQHQVTLAVGSWSGPLAALTGGLAGREMRWMWWAAVYMHTLPAPLGCQHLTWALARPMSSASAGALAGASARGISRLTIHAKLAHVRFGAAGDTQAAKGDRDRFNCVYVPCGNRVGTAFDSRPKYAGPAEWEYKNTACAGDAAQAVRLAWRGFGVSML